MKNFIVPGLVFLIALVLLGLGIFFGSARKSSSVVQAPSPSPVPSPVIGGVITYDGGFLPGEVEVKIGEAVEFRNDSQETFQVNSDNHPSHALYPELNLGVVGPGKVKSTVFEKAGTYTYHNHLKPTEKGTIVVE